MSDGMLHPFWIKDHQHPLECFHSHRHLSAEQFSQLGYQKVLCDVGDVGHKLLTCEDWGTSDRLLNKFTVMLAIGAPPADHQHKILGRVSLHCHGPSLRFHIWQLLICFRQPVEDETRWRTRGIFDTDNHWRLDEFRNLAPGIREHRTSAVLRVIQPPLNLEWLVNIVSHPEH